MIERAVVDASVAVKWIVKEEGSDRARLLSGARLEAPDLLFIECANILWKKTERHELNRRDAAARLELLLRAPVSVTASRALLDAALALALHLRRPIYDCVYLALAVARDIPLVTADEKLVAAAGRVAAVASHVKRLGDISA